MKKRYSLNGGTDGFPLRVAKATLIAGAIVAGALLLWQIRGVILLGFAAVVLAVLLLAAAQLVERWTRLPHRLALSIAVLAVIALAGVLLWAGWPSLQSQSEDLMQRLPTALDNVVRRFESWIPISLATEGSEGGAGIGEIGSIASEIFSATRSFLAGLSSLVLVIITAIYIAAWPEAYREGLIKLFPIPVQKRIGDALTKSGHALKLWLVGQALAMLTVGLLVGLGAWAIGLPAPFALGVFAGLVEFIPIVGPLIGAVPAILLASQESFTLLAWTLVLFLGIQQVESNVITPQIQQHMVLIPPALYILSLMALGAVFGFVGVLVSAPMTVAVFVLVKELYVRQTLGEDTSIPGEET